VLLYTHLCKQQTGNINCRDVQRKNDVNNVDTCMSSLRAPWQNSPLTMIHTVNLTVSGHRQIRFTLRNTLLFFQNDIVFRWWLSNWWKGKPSGSYSLSYFKVGVGCRNMINWSQVVIMKRLTAVKVPRNYLLATPTTSILSHDFENTCIVCIYICS